jgi:hypothetical protein
VSPAGWLRSAATISLCRRLSRWVRPPTSTTASGSPRPRTRSRPVALPGCGVSPGAVRVVPVSASRASSDSAIRAAARIIARLCGDATSGPPVISTTPSTRLVVGSWIGAAAQLQGWTSRLKCSAAWTCTGWPRRSAIPGALVPASCSVHTEPSTKLMVSARRSTPRRAAHPQQLAFGVADGHDDVAVDRGAAQHVIEEREHVGKGMGGAVVGEVAAVEPDRRKVGVRVHAGGRGAQPRLGDDRAHPGCRCGARSRAPPGVPRRRVAGTHSDSQPRAGRSRQLRALRAASEPGLAPQPAPRVSRPGAPPRASC